MAEQIDKGPVNQVCSRAKFSTFSWQALKSVTHVKLKSDTIILHDLLWIFLIISLMNFGFRQGRMAVELRLKQEFPFQDFEAKCNTVVSKWRVFETHLRGWLQRWLQKMNVQKTFCKKANGATHKWTFILVVAEFFLKSQSLPCRGWRGWDFTAINESVEMSTATFSTVSAAFIGGHYRKVPPSAR